MNALPYQPDFQNARSHTENASVMTQRLNVSEDVLNALDKQVVPSLDLIVAYRGYSEVHDSGAMRPLFPTLYPASATSKAILDAPMSFLAVDAVIDHEFNESTLISATVKLRNQGNGAAANLKIGTDAEGSTTYTVQQSSSASAVENAPEDNIGQSAMTTVLHDLLTQTASTEQVNAGDYTVDQLLVTLAASSKTYRVHRTGTYATVNTDYGQSTTSVVHYPEAKPGQLPSYRLKLSSKQPLNGDGTAFVASSVIIEADRGREKTVVARLQAGIVEADTNRGVDYRSRLLQGAIEKYEDPSRLSQVVVENLGRIASPLSDGIRRV